MEMTMYDDRYKGVLLGCAVGDTLGMAVEGWKPVQIQRYVPGGKITEPIAPVLVYDAEGALKHEDEFGKLKYFAKDLKRGEWTDDTILTLALTESIIERRGLNLETAARKHLEAYEGLRMHDGRVKGGFGSTTQEAFKNLAAGVSPRASGVIGGPGNAPAMKMHPLGMYIHATRKERAGLLFAYDVGRMTHLDPRSLASGVVQAAAISALLKNVSRREFVRTIVRTCKEWEGPLGPAYIWHHQGTLAERLLWIENHTDVSSQEAYERLGNSSVVYRSYPFSLFMFQKYGFSAPEQAREGLLETVNFGGDCDTTGAIYGALAGANHGTSWIPDSWLAVLDQREQLEEAAASLYALGGTHE